MIPRAAYRRGAFGSFLALALAAFGPSPSTVNGHTQGCTRIRVEIADRGVVVTSYEVAAAEYVSRIHRLIDANGTLGSWTVATGELGYSVTYHCLA
jgi:hypothetical protein